MIRFLGRPPNAEMRSFGKWLEDQMEIRHRVNIHLTTRLFGYFDAPGRYHGFDPYAVVSLEGEPLTTVAHELVHYERWRDKRDDSSRENGVEQRARALVRRWRREKGE